MSRQVDARDRITAVLLFLLTLGVLGAAQPVHRLDEGTSGLMLVARTAPARAGLIAQLARDTPPDRKIARRYLAITDKTFPEGPPRAVETTLLEDRGDGRRRSGPGGVRSLTHLKLRNAQRRTASVVAWGEKFG